MTTTTSGTTGSERRQGVRARVRNAAGVLALCSGILGATAGPAAAAPPPMTTSVTNAYAAPTPYSSLIGGILSGAVVTMYCWTDSVWADGTNRWFLVTGLGWSPYSGRLTSIHGFVSATRIKDQARVGHC